MWKPEPRGRQSKDPYSAFPGVLSCLFPVLFPVLQEYLSRDKVVDHNHACRPDLGDHIEDPYHVHRDPHNDLVDPQTDHAQDDEHSEILRLAPVPADVEHPFHTGDIIVDHRDRERNPAGDQIIDPHHFREEDHDQIIDQKGSHAHECKPDDLLF